jgi:hypothetical protein
MKLLVVDTAMLELDGFTLSRAPEQPIFFVSQGVIRGNVVLGIFFLWEVLGIVMLPTGGLFYKQWYLTMAAYNLGSMLYVWSLLKYQPLTGEYF